VAEEVEGDERKLAVWKIDEGRPPFIGAEGDRCTAAMSTMARAFRRAKGVGDDGILFCGSWRFFGRRRLG
jgi:hypothetical protein